MSARINFRTDGWHDLDQRQYLIEGNEHAVYLGDTPEKQREKREQLLALEPAQPGDIWRVRWHSNEGEGPLAGYAICCPRCKHIHIWSSANNCQEGIVDGLCVHRRSTNGGNLGSCWQWSGSAEKGTLTAHPSLHATGACGWHGWLRNGVLSEA